MRTPSYDPAELEAQIGERGAAAVNSGNRALVQNWLCAQGVPSERAKSMKVSTLWKCYNRPRYLAAVQAHIGKPAEMAETLANAETVESTIIEAARDLAAEPVETVAPAITVPAPVASLPAPTDAAGHLVAAIQAISAGAINEARVIELIREHAKPETIYQEKLVILANNERRELPPDIRHCAFPRVLSWVSANVPLMAVGSAGTGKTHMFEQIAAVLGLRYGFMGAASSRHDLSGYDDANGVFHALSLFPDFYENGGLLLWDEVDNSDPGALPWANTAIANGFCAFGARIVKRHPDFRLVAAANTYGRGADRLYVGRAPIDAAVTDRFAFESIDYDEDMERALYGATPWVARVQAVRHAVQNLKLRHVVSMRASDYGTRLVGKLPQEAIESALLWKGLESDQIAAIEREAAQ